MAQFKYLGIVFDDVGSWVRHVKRRMQATDVAHFKLINAYNQAENMPFETVKGLHESPTQGTATYSAETTPMPIASWGFSKNKFMRMLARACPKFSKISLESILSIPPYETRAISNRIGFLTRAINQATTTLSHRAFFESVKLSLFLKKGWFYETMGLLKDYNIDIGRVTHDSAYHGVDLNTDLKAQKENAYKHPRKLAEELNIYGQLCQRWREQMRDKLCGESDDC